jgi:hypothetical protein
MDRNDTEMKSISNCFILLPIFSVACPSLISKGIQKDTYSTIGFSPSTNKLRPKGGISFDDNFELSSVLFDDCTPSLLVDCLDSQI